MTDASVNDCDLVGDISISAVAENLMYGCAEPIVIGWAIHILCLGPVGADCPMHWTCNGVGSEVEGWTEAIAAGDLLAVNLDSVMMLPVILAMTDASVNDIDLVVDASISTVADGVVNGIALPMLDGCAIHWLLIIPPGGAEASCHWTCNNVGAEVILMSMTMAVVLPLLTVADDEGTALGTHDSALAAALASVNDCDL